MYLLIATLSAVDGQYEYIHTHDVDAITLYAAPAFVMCVAVQYGVRSIAKTLIQM